MQITLNLKWLDDLRAREALLLGAICREYADSSKPYEMRYLTDLGVISSYRQNAYVIETLLKKGYLKKVESKKIIRVFPNMEIETIKEIVEDLEIRLKYE